MSHDRSTLLNCFTLQVSRLKWAINGLEISYETKYSRVDQEKFVEDSL